MSYVAPLKDMLFNIEHLAQIDQVAQMPGFEDAGLETAQAVLQECAKLNQDAAASSPQLLSSSTRWCCTNRATSGVGHSMALEDGKWHHEDSYKPETRDPKRPQDVLWLAP